MRMDSETILDDEIIRLRQNLALMKKQHSSMTEENTRLIAEADVAQVEMSRRKFKYSDGSYSDSVSSYSDTSGDEKNRVPKRFNRRSKIGTTDLEDGEIGDAPIKTRMSVKKKHKRISKSQEGLTRQLQEELNENKALREDML